MRDRAAWSVRCGSRAVTPAPVLLVPLPPSAHVLTRATPRTAPAPRTDPIGPHRLNRKTRIIAAVRCNATPRSLNSCITLSPLNTASILRGDARGRCGWWRLVSEHGCGVLRGGERQPMNLLAKISPSERDTTTATASPPSRRCFLRPPRFSSAGRTSGIREPRAITAPRVRPAFGPSTLPARGRSMRTGRGPAYKRGQMDEAAHMERAPRKSSTSAHKGWQHPTDAAEHYT